MDKLMIVDGNSILNRAFYGLQGRNMLSNADGLYTNAIYGFLNILNKFMVEERPNFLAVAFDLKAPTFRHKAFEGYKAQRKGMPPELAVQLPVMKEVLEAMNIKILEQEGYEADDILGSLSKAAEDKGMEAILITGDRDSLQLASPTTRIKIPTTKGGSTLTEEFDDKGVVEKYGVTPLKFIDVKGLMGDSSDNIPGVAGIGEKTAISLIQEFGSIEEIYNHIDEVQKKGVKEKLIAGKDMAFMSKSLATIFRDMELCSLEELKVVEPQKDKLRVLFNKLEFRTLIAKYGLDKVDVDSELITTTEKDFTLRILKSNSELSEYISKLKVDDKAAIFPLLDKRGFNSVMSGFAITIDCKEVVFISIDDSNDEDKVINILKPFFENEGIIKYTHDVKSLYLYLHKKGIFLKSANFDTFLAEYLVDPSNTSYGVDRLARVYLGRELKSLEELLGKGKGVKSFRDIEPGERAEFAASYVESIYLLTGELSKKIEETNQHELYFSIELPLAKVLADMEFHGFKVNVNELIDFSKELDEKIKVLEKTIYELSGENFNINSPKQLGVILFEKLGLPVVKKTKTGYSTDVEVLEQLMDKHEIVENIVNFRQLMKLKSTYVEGLMAVINPETGKIHSSFNQTVTTTGRISSTEPNLQNIPIRLELGRKIRKVFVPSDDSFLLLDADYSQIELRVLAHIADDANMITAFTDNEDIHTATASNVFGVALEDVTPKMRSNAKAVNFGIVYGIGDFSLSKDLGITRKEARAYIDGYLDKYPGVRDYMKNIVAEGKENGFVTTLFKRRRYLPEITSSNFNIRSFGERIAMNTPIQGSAADIIKIAMVKVYEALEKGGFKSRLILQVHDELIIETAREEEKQVEEILKNCMEQAVSLKVPLTAEVKSGSNWFETK